MQTKTDFMRYFKLRISRFVVIFKKTYDGLGRFCYV